MSATDELRRMLDEHDEYYKTSGNKTWWGRPIDRQTGKPINVFHYQAQPMGEDRLFVELQLATPAQAIAATVGTGTLTAEQVSNATYAHSIHADCADADWQAIADELNDALGRVTCHEVEDEDTGFIVCSECGAVHDVSYTSYYCWCCGRKVVDE